MLVDQDISAGGNDISVSKSPRHIVYKHSANNAKASSTELPSAACTRHGDLLTLTKVSVKRIMEEAVTKKMIYFNSSTVNGLCVAIDRCLLDGLSRRAVGMFEESLSLALLKKISKDCEEASFILTKMTTFSDLSSPHSAAHSARPSQENAANPMSYNAITALFNRSKQSPIKYLWIKLAMLEKKLLRIVEFIMEDNHHYYHKNSIMSSYVSGSIFIELITGPCFLDLSVVKPSDHIWNEPDASELLDRHLIHSVYSWPTIADETTRRSRLIASRSLKSRPFLKIRYNTSPLEWQDSISNNNKTDAASNVVANDYVESLHQNLKHVLLYGKNNVLVQPKEDLDEMQGYLSLHLITGDKLRLNWTPNKLMNYKLCQDGNCDNELFPQRMVRQNSGSSVDWDSALSIRIEHIVYLHCHNDEVRGGTVTFVSQDGVQHPPFRFPPGGHLLQFVVSLDNGLHPSSRLDPPLLQINDAEKTFPRDVGHSSNNTFAPSDDSDQPTPSLGRTLINNFNRSLRRRKDVAVKIDNSDFVFKIVLANDPSAAQVLDRSLQQYTNHSVDTNRESQFPLNEEDSFTSNTSSIDTLCTAMTQQILSRAFHGWRQHCRNIKTVRTQFHNLVQSGSVQSDVPCDANEGLTAAIWEEYKLNKDTREEEIYRLIYFGGCQDSIRHEVWPRMLGHYSWTMLDTSQSDFQTELEYEKSLSQWKALEIIIAQRESENDDGDIENQRVQTMLLTDATNGSNRTVNISHCDVHPSAGFYSSSDSVDATDSPLGEDLTFTHEDIVFMTDSMPRIDKDVDRCDRNHPYFMSHGKDRLKGKGNLRKLRNIMVTWVWQHQSIGYVQGMCDLLAPLLVVLDNESLTHACFTKLMQTMFSNFPQMESRMDDNLSMMALLLQIIDRHLYEHMCPNGEVTSLYVAYRWLLLDFKRELCYADVFSVWETIWSARHIASDHFNLFLALSLLQYYRDIILDNKMEYTDIIKFYNEMAEKHQIQKVLYIARGLIESIREIVQSR